MADEPQERRFDWHGLIVPVELPEVVDEISYERVVMNAGATWDYFPGHFDPEYAKRQGHPTIFVNTMHFAGFVDRVGDGLGRSLQSSPAAQDVAAGFDLCGRHDDRPRKGYSQALQHLWSGSAISHRPAGWRLQPARRTVLSRRGHPRGAGGIAQLGSGGNFPLHATDCSSTYSSRPSGPNSRPMPECLKPPNGVLMSSMYMLMP